MSAARSFQLDLCALFGQPVAENPTQVMIEAAFADLGLAWRYLTIEVAPAALPDAIRGMRAMGFRGANCTLPHKVAVVPLLDELTPAAQAIGAVNCMVRRGDRLIGENTDGKGFLQSVTELGPVQGKRIVILGAGGAARAIAVELLQAGAAELTIVNRGRQRAADLRAVLDRVAAGRCGTQAWEGDLVVPPGTDLLINATSIGLYPDLEARVPVRFESLTPATVVCDVIPNPPRTGFLRAAAARGCRTLDGLGMLVHQGVIGVKLWTGRAANATVMRAALEEVFRP